MKTHDECEKEVSNPKGKRDRKSKLFNGEPKGISSAENHHHPDTQEDTTARISFLVDFSLAEGEVRGKIIHRLTDKQAEFVGLDQATITQFMKKYLSRLEKNVIKMPQEETSHQIHELAEGKEEEVKEIPASEMRTRSFGIIPAGTGLPTGILQQGQPFRLEWVFEPPSILTTQGEKLDYKVVVCRKRLAGGGRELFGEIKGQIDFTQTLTARFPSEPLPTGTYRLEGEAAFWSSKSKTPGHRSTCSDSCLVQVI
jgi:hypothetical protein